MRSFLMIAMTTGVAAGLGLVPAPARAQTAIEGRVDRLESELRAVQRKVFPGGAGQLVQPDITGAAPDLSLPGTPANSPVVDLNARVNALEAQMTSLTGQVEVAQHRLQMMEDAFGAYKRATDARLKTIESGGGGTPVADAAAPGRDAAPAPAGKPPVEKRPGEDQARRQKVAAIVKPATADPAEDAYIYGYRLWEAGLYPEAETQLRSVVKTYPDHRRASYAQNLLGRAYLDDGQASAASIEFYNNYKKMPDGDRAPDSLYYLAQALMKLNKPGDACEVYRELGSVYGGRIAASMKADIVRGQAEAKCR